MSYRSFCSVILRTNDQRRPSCDVEDVRPKPRTRVTSIVHITNEDEGSVLNAAQDDFFFNLKRTEQQSPARVLTCELAREVSLLTDQPLSLPAFFPSAPQLPPSLDFAYKFENVSFHRDSAERQQSCGVWNDSVAAFGVVDPVVKTVEKVASQNTAVIQVLKSENNGIANDNPCHVQTCIINASAVQNNETSIPNDTMVTIDISTEHSNPMQMAAVDEFRQKLPIASQSRSSPENSIEQQLSTSTDKTKFLAGKTSVYLNAATEKVDVPVGGICEIHGNDDKVTPKSENNCSLEIKDGEVSETESDTKTETSETESEKKITDSSDEINKMEENVHFVKDVSEDFLTCSSQFKITKINREDLSKCCRSTPHSQLMDSEDIVGSASPVVETEIFQPNTNTITFSDEDSPDSLNDVESVTLDLAEESSLSSLESSPAIKITKSEIVLLVKKPAKAVNTAESWGGQQELGRSTPVPAARHSKTNRFGNISKLFSPEVPAEIKFNLNIDPEYDSTTIKSVSTEKQQELNFITPMDGQPRREPQENLLKSTVASFTEECFTVLKKINSIDQMCVRNLLDLQQTEKCATSQFEVSCEQLSCAKPISDDALPISSLAVVMDTRGSVPNEEFAQESDLSESATVSGPNGTSWKSPTGVDPESSDPWAPQTVVLSSSGPELMEELLVNLSSLTTDGLDFKLVKQQNCFASQAALERDETPSKTIIKLKGMFDITV